jgi:hypothetical protein
VPEQVGLAVASRAGLGNVPTNWGIYGTADLNGDGRGDLLWQDSTTGTVAAWFMNGAALAASAVYGAVGGSWRIAGTTPGTIYWRDGSGNLAIWQVNASQITASAGLGNVPTNWVIAGFGDFNGDGVSDFLWRDMTSGLVAIWFMTSEMTIQSGVVIGAVGGTWNIAQTGDYNGDGLSDILWIDGTGNLVAWFMNGAQISATAAYGSVGTSFAVQAQNAE